MASDLLKVEEGLKKIRDGASSELSDRYVSRLNDLIDNDLASRGTVDTDYVNRVVDFLNELVPATSQTFIAGEGDGSQTQFTYSLDPINVDAGTLTITAVDLNGNLLTVTDDGSGNLTGDVDGTGNNTVDYGSGAVDVTFSAAILTGAKVVNEYDVLSPVENGEVDTHEISILTDVIATLADRYLGEDVEAISIDD